MIEDRQTQTDTLITILRSPIGGGVIREGNVIGIDGEVIEWFFKILFV